MSQEQGLDGTDNAAGQSHQYYDNGPQVVPQQPLHLQLVQSQQQRSLHQQQPYPQSLLVNEANSSLVYDRTIKVLKKDYADHGSHGVAALPLPGAGHGETSNGMVGADAPGGGLPSSIQMQLQMQKIAAARLALEQQQQRQQCKLMPPPPSGGRGHYSSLVPGSMGELRGAEGSGLAAQPIMNTTSSVGLMQAFNAQMAANQQAQAHAATMMDNVGVASNVDQEQQRQGDSMGDNNLAAPTTGDVANSNSLSGIAAIGGGGGSSGAATNPDMIPPGEIRNGKKRVSPSVPLHPSQLGLHHSGGIGGMLPPQTTGGIPLVSSNLGMNAVAEEEESLCNATFNVGVEGMVDQRSVQQQLLQPQQVLDQSVLNIVNPQGLLGSVLNDQSSLLPQSQHSEPQPRKQQKKRSQKSSAAAPSSSSPEKGHGEVLTNPSIPAANSGLDNAEGNLIVRRGDVLRIPQKNLHSHPPSAALSSDDKKSPLNGRNGSEDVLEYRVVSLLGQGTFAQVFHCVDEGSRKSIAVKIVKNKPAYTRQAAVEIDVFRKLNSADGGDAGTSHDAAGESLLGDTGADHIAGGRSGSRDAGHSKGCSASTSISTFSSFDSSTDAQASLGCAERGEGAIIRLMSYFMHASHLCLVFEMLGPNLYELLKKRQFRGLPMGAVRTLVRQATEGIKLLGRKSVVHCDLKPENILMVRSEDLEGAIAECKSQGEEQIGKNAVGGGGTPGRADKSSVAATPSTLSKETEEQWIKLIDFGSACFEGQTTHTYIQSRFYRSPEVLIGLPYDSAIDIWSLGCVAAELFLGLPILPGVHEHDQLGRILEMIGPIPDWMLEQGSKSSKFFKNAGPGSRSGSRTQQFGPSGSESSPSGSSWEFKTRQEYINFLTEEERRSKGGLSKLEQQQTNRYFKKKKLEDIVMHHGVCNTKKEREQLGLFVHFLKGVLDPDPWKRWTAHQASMHPFLTGSSAYRIKSSGSDVSGGGGAKPYDIHWVPPWDASAISRRKLMIFQKTKEKAAAAQAQVVSRSSRRLSLNDNHGGRNIISQSVPETSASVPLTGILQHPHLSAQVLDIYGSPLRRKKLEPLSPAEMSMTSQVAIAMAETMSLERGRSSNASGKGTSPPQTLVNGGIGGGLGNHQLMYDPRYPPPMLSASLGGAGMPMSYQQLADAGVAATAASSQQSNLGRSYSDNAQAEHIAVAAQQQLNDVAFMQPPPPLPPPPVLMGAQSYSGAYGYQGMPGSHNPYVESELGYALQRPGVVPGMGSDAFVGALRRQSSSNNAALFAQQHNQMLSASLSNLSSSTPQNYGVSTAASTGGPINYQSAMSPGGLLLQKLGLQDQMLGTSSYNARDGGAGGGAGGTSLLAQQLEEYSSLSDNQQGQGQVHQQHAPQVHNRNNPLMGRHRSSSNVVHRGSSGMINSGSYHRGAAAPAVPLSLTSLPYMQNASFSDLNSAAMQQQQQSLAAQMHPQLGINTVYPNNGGSLSGQHNNAPRNGRSNERMPRKLPMG